MSKMQEFLDKYKVYLFCNTIKEAGEEFYSGEIELRTTSNTLVAVVEEIPLKGGRVKYKTHNPPPGMSHEELQNLFAEHAEEILQIAYALYPNFKAKPFHHTFSVNFHIISDLNESELDEKDIIEALMKRVESIKDGKKVSWRFEHTTANTKKPVR